MKKMITKINKNLFALTIGLIFCFLLCNYSYGQYAAKPVVFKDSKIFNSYVRTIAAMDETDLTNEHVPDLAKTLDKAVKDFQIRFNKVSNVQWFSGTKNIESYFFQDGFSGRAFYSKKGRWLYSLTFHNQYKLPPDLRSLIKSAYSDYDITLVEEVQTNIAVLYVVYLQDKSSIKIITINMDGEMEILQNLVTQ